MLVDVILLDSYDGKFNSLKVKKCLFDREDGNTQEEVVDNVVYDIIKNPEGYDTVKEFRSLTDLDRYLQMKDKDIGEVMDI